MVLYAFARDAEFRQLTSFVSPAFFRVMPAGQLMKQARRLMANRRDAAAFECGLRERGERLADARLPIATKPAIAASASGVHPMAPATIRSVPDHANALVQLYFHQLFDDGACILDLRRTAFSAGESLTWEPAPWFVEWEPSFIEPLRSLYRGFYTGDDLEFRGALGDLGLESAEDTFREHFGEGQRRVKFRRKHFVETFQEVFLRCSRANARLHSNFLPLGIYLATLYDHLEQLDVAVDVESCFHRGLSATNSQGAIHA